MKILHTADWHIGQFKGPVEDGVNLRSLDTVKCLEFMVETAKEVRPDLVCVSGDVFHQEQIGPVRYSDEMVTATRIIEDLSECAKFEKAGAAITDCRNKILKYDENGDVVLATSGKDIPIGVALIEAGCNDITGAESGKVSVGDDVDILVKDIGFVLAGAVITKGQEIAAGANGLAAVHDHGDSERFMGQTEVRSRMDQC